MLPAIVAFRLNTAPAEPTEYATLATMTVEHGPWIIAGLRLVRRADGAMFLHPPKMKTKPDRVAMRSGQERDALIREATEMLHAFTKARAAVSPLAPAPEPLEPTHEHPPFPS